MSVLVYVCVQEASRLCEGLARGKERKEGGPGQC